MCSSQTLPVMPPTTERVSVATAIVCSPGCQAVGQVRGDVAVFPARNRLAIEVDLHLVRRKQGRDARALAAYPEPIAPRALPVGRHREAFAEHAALGIGKLRAVPDADIHARPCAVIDAGSDERSGRPAIVREWARKPNPHPAKMCFATAVARGREPAFWSLSTNRAGA
jgi:hypothetical protein